MRKASEIVFELWSKGVERNLTGEDRLEDKHVSNIKDFKEVDLGFPFVFADVDLIVDGNDDFTWYDFENLRSYIEKTGWRLPNFEEINRLFFKHSSREITHDYIIFDYERKNGYDVAHISVKNFPGVLDVNIDNPHATYFWADWSSKQDEINPKADKTTARMWMIRNDKYVRSGDYFSTGNLYKDKQIKIRLVKDK